MSVSIRRAVILALAVVLLVPGATVAAESREAQAVTWTVDHAAKTITATVRLRLASACTRGQMARATTQGPAAAKRCKVGPEVVKAIKDNIDGVWNRGYRYFCYTLKVVTDIEVSDELTGAVAGSDATPDDRAFIAIDQSPVGVRSFVATRQYPDGTWDGYTTRDTLIPANGGARPSTWEYPPLPGDVALYAHELGHVMGLDDSYEDYTTANGETASRTRAGAPEDLMANQRIATIDQSTISRLGGRAGVDPYALECDWTVEGEVAGGRMTGTKCGGIAGAWTMATDLTQGPTSVQQTWRLTADTGGRGDFTYKDHVLTKVPQSVAEGWGEASGSGTVAIQWDGTVTMTLNETRHRSKGKGTAGGRTFTTPEADVPLVDYEFVWKPTVCPS